MGHRAPALDLGGVVFGASEADVLRAAEGVDHPGAHVVDGDERRDHRVGDGELLEDPHGVDPAQAGTADVLAAVDRRDAQFRRLPQHLDGEMLGLVPVQGVRCQAFGREGGRGLDDHPFVAVQGGEVQAG